MKLSMKQKQIMDTENSVVVAKGGGGGRRMDWEFGISRGGLGYLEWKKKKNKCCSVEHTKLSSIPCDKSSRKRTLERLRKQNPFAVQKTEAQHCKPTILHLKIKNYSSPFLVPNDTSLHMEPFKPTSRKTSAWREISLRVLRLLLQRWIWSGRFICNFPFRYDMVIKVFLGTLV